MASSVSRHIFLGDFLIEEYYICGAILTTPRMQR